jgi:hypothetical protein
VHLKMKVMTMVAPGVGAAAAKMTTSMTLAMMVVMAQATLMAGNGLP